MTGKPLAVIQHENDQCRNLCVQCHSGVTCAERAVGILRLKTLDKVPGGISVHLKRRALHQVETLTHMLLGIEWNKGQVSI